MTVDTFLSCCVPSGVTLEFTYQQNMSHLQMATNIQDPKQAWIFLSQLLLLNGSPERSQPGSAAGKKKKVPACVLGAVYAFFLDHENKLAPAFQKKNNSPVQQADGWSGQEASLPSLSPALCQALSQGPHLRRSCQIGETNMFADTHSPAF